LLNQVCQDEKLEEVAREAKERLDERLKTHLTVPVMIILSLKA
jgi:hypothetical protein